MKKDINIRNIEGMNSGYAIKLESVSKRFRLVSHKEKTIVGAIKRLLNIEHKEEFNALKDISIAIRKGETIGLIGDNGAGKSTLLRIIGGIYVPTSGSVITDGKIMPLIELGVGLEEELTAKENIFLYGAILGMGKREMQKKTEKILTFAGVKRFEDAKLKTFSTGMKVRLAFSIMKETDPDILLLDEVFAVGDKGFQKKSLDVIQRFRKEKKTIIVSSHYLREFKDFCDKIIYLENGKIIMFDRSDRVLKYYESRA